MRCYRLRWSTVGFCALALLAACSVSAQVYRYYRPGTVWTITAIRMKAGMDQTYMQYLDGQFRKNEDAQVKAGYEKSYKLLRTLDDEYGGNSWNLIILREYPNLTALETNAEKSDALAQQTEGDDQVQIKGYEDRSKFREVMWTKTARELLLK
jgi:hypothetical protein